jgi:acetoin utilization deacetylase AcuC-like enzyme
VHHGNGTQASFYDVPETLYFSTHRYPFYPGTGGVDEVGEGEGRGYTVNVPMRGGMGDGEIIPAFRRVLEPIAEKYEPLLVLVSAGFDAHRLDPLGGMGVTGEGFAELARIVKGVARHSAGGKLVLALEGGYSDKGLAESITAVMRVLLEDGPAPPGGGSAPETPLGRELSEYVRHTQGRYWKALA